MRGDRHTRVDAVNSNPTHFDCIVVITYRPFCLFVSCFDDVFTLLFFSFHGFFFFLSAFDSSVCFVVLLQKSNSVLVTFARIPKAKREKDRHTDTSAQRWWRDISTLGFAEQRSLNWTRYEHINQRSHSEYEYVGEERKKRATEQNINPQRVRIKRWAYTITTWLVKKKSH